MVLFYMPKDFQELYELRLPPKAEQLAMLQLGGRFVNSIHQAFDVFLVYAGERNPDVMVVRTDDSGLVLVQKVLPEVLSVGPAPERHEVSAVERKRPEVLVSLIFLQAFLELEIALSDYPDPLVLVGIVVGIRHSLENDVLSGHRAA